MAKIASKISKLIANKYRVDRITNSFSYKPKDNPKDLIQTEIGDSKDTTKFQPQIKIMRWDNEVNLSFRLKDDKVATETIITSQDKIVWSKGKIKANFYDFSEGEGGYEFEVILEEKPTTNKIEFTLQTKGLDFFYQPELTQKEKDGGANRPDNIVGSYAVYASKNKINYVGGKEYKCGKVGHIFRPKIIDSMGTEVWGELNIDINKGILSITIPQDFLDKAVYPIKHAAGLTFGYTGAGSSPYALGNCICMAGANFVHTATTGDTVTTFFLYGKGADKSFDMAIYNIETTPKNRLATEVTVNLSNVMDWYSVGGQSQSLSNGVIYGVAVGNGNGNLYYDSGTGDNRSIDNLSTLPASWTHDNWSTTRWSIYCIYTIAGPEEKLFEDIGEGAEILLADKILSIIDSGEGTDKWVLPQVIFIDFSDSGSGLENLLVDKVLLLEDSGSGAESWIANKLREFADSGVGIDIFLRDWIPIFIDSGSGVEAYYKVFHYPANLKRVIILIRDKK